MSSNDIFVPFLDLCRSVETDYAIKPTFHQTEPLIAGFGGAHRATSLMLLDAPQPIWVVA
jgi:hypothetical protein